VPTQAYTSTKTTFIIHTLFFALQPISNISHPSRSFTASKMFTKPATSLLLATLATSVLGSVAPAMTMDERWLARRALNVGMGTRYGADCTEEDCWQKGACAFTDYTLPASVDGSTCVSEDIWNNGYQCGGCISVSYKGKTITVMVRSTASCYRCVKLTGCGRSLTRPAVTRTTWT
jgi:hypothetical protein